MGIRWVAAMLSLGTLAAAADPPPPPVRFTLHTRALLADVQARDGTLGIPVDRPGKKLKTLYGKSLALLTAEARTFDADLDSAWKAARLLEKALPGDGDMAALIGAVTAGFAADLTFEAGLLRAGAPLADPKPEASILAGLDAVDAALASAESLRDYRSAARKIRRPRDQFALAYAGLGGDPELFRIGPGLGGVGIPGRPLGAGDHFEATGSGMSFQPVGVYPSDGSTMGNTIFLGGPLSKPRSTSVSGFALALSGPVDSPLGIPVPVDPELSSLKVTYSSFEGSGTAAYGTLEKLSSLDPGTGTVTFSELDPATGTWAASFDVTFQSGHSLSGSFRVSGLQ